MRYSLSENAAFGDDGVLVPAAGTGSIHDVVWICYSPYVATNYPLQSFSTRIYNGLWKLRSLGDASSFLWTLFTYSDGRLPV